MRNLFNTIEKSITSLIAIGVLSMVLRLFIHIAMSHEFVWYQWLYIGFVALFLTFVSCLIFALIFQAWKQDRV